MFTQILQSVKKKMIDAVSEVLKSNWASQKVKPCTVPMNSQLCYQVMFRPDNDK